MKTINTILAVITLAITFTACNPDNIEMTTVVNADGSFTRAIRFESDSLTMDGMKTERKHLIDVLDNELWQKSWETVSDTSSEAENKNKLFCTAVRQFDDIAALNENYPIEINGTKILKQGELERHFRGFYTDITFREVYADLSSAFSVPSNLFLSRDELSYWTSGYPNITEGIPGRQVALIISDIEEKFCMWHAANEIYDILTIITDNYDSFEKCPLTRDELLAARDNTMSSEYWKENNDKFNNNTAADLDNGEYTTLNTFLGNEYFSKEGKERLSNIVESSHYSDKYNNVGNSDKITYTLVMPGSITTKGIGVLQEGNRICYTISGMHLLSSDYTIEATSRVINWWFVVLAFIIIFIPIGIIVYTRTKH